MPLGDVGELVGEGCRGFLAGFAELLVIFKKYVGSFLRAFTFSIIFFKTCFLGFLSKS